MGLKEEVIEIKKEVEEVKESSFAYELLKDQIAQNKLNTKRWFITWLITFIVLVSLSIFTFWLLNDIGTYEDTITQENTDGYNNYIGNDGDIINGKASD